jgi:O-antigen ligase
MGFAMSENSQVVEQRGGTSYNLTTGVFAGLLAIVVLVPLPFGSSRPLAWDILALSVGMLLLATLFLPGQLVAFMRAGLLGPAVLFFLVIGFALIQTATWVPIALQNPLWEQAGEIFGQSVHGSIAIDRNAADVYVLRLTAYAGIFYLSWIVGRNQAFAHYGLKAVTLSGFIYALYALLVYWSGNAYVLWYQKWAYSNDLTGSFINRNSFATYLGLCTLAAFCRLFVSIAHIELHDEDWRRRLAVIFELISARIWRLILLFILVMALLLTHSRGGLVATLFGIMVLMLSFSLAPSLRRLRSVSRWTMLPFAVIFVALLIGGGVTFDRFVTADIDSQQRLTVYQLTMQAIGDYPFRGIGLGGFPSIFPIYRTQPISFYFDLAHNEYLQNALELGLPAALCLLAALGWLVIRCLQGMRIRMRDAVFPCLGIAATALVAIHSMVDFSLQIPAVTVTYLFLLGIAIAQSQSSRSAADKS